MNKNIRRILPAAVMAVALTTPMVLAAGPAHAALANRSCGTIAASDSTTAADLNKVLTGKLRGAMTAYRLSCARAIADATRARGLPDRAAVIAITTAITESVLENNPNMVDHTSVGLFQQQDWWGSFEERLDPAYSTNAFLDAMLKLYPNNSWQTQQIGVVCQKVQVSAYPDRYEPEAADAQRILDALTRVVSASKAHVEVVGSDGAMWTTDGDYSAGQWSGSWASLGGTGLKDLTSTLTGNTMHVYAIGSTGRVYTRDADYTTGQWSGSWAEIPGSITGATAITASATGTTVHLSAIGSNGAMWTTDGNYEAGEWTGSWASLGGTGLKALTSTVTGNTMHLYALGSTGRVYTKDADYTTGQWTTDWAEIPGNTTGATAITASATGTKVHLEIVGADGAMWTTDGDYTAGQWTGTWASLGGTGLKKLTSTVTGNTMHVYALGSTGRVYTKDADYTTGQWTTDWAEIPGNTTGATAITATVTK
ncbi:hypothetical protein [Streptomyces sp. ISL-94]|uniref:hypothetical protein n=1 Tax=Streptomyces sp. ISL-94 TaxID=2819190 RepID=UPI001BEB2A68|nr:hypothetical protein [Streptomyces sp. ISL-94]MBT2477744.1 hypothetical protein [Streptomyces sp. ISL-94]